MSLLWPTHPNPYVGFFGRLGQLAHWCGLFLGLLALWAFANPSGLDSPAVGVFYGVLIYFSGRGLRYLFAGE